MADHDGHTINVGQVTVGDVVAPLDAPHQCSCRACAGARYVNRMRAENAALAGALADIAGMRRYNDGSARERWVADAECSAMGTRLCYERGPDDPGEWCPACVAEVAWVAWKIGALR